MDTQRRQTFIDSLRACADFLEQHPEIPTPYAHTLNVFVETREALVDVAKGSSWNKRYSEDYFWLSKEFCDDLRLEINTNRNLVCRKIVTGMRVVPAQPAREVEEIEWICDEPLLATK